MFPVGWGLERRDGVSEDLSSWAVPIPALLKVLHGKGCTAPYRADHAPGMYGQDLNFGYGLAARAQGLIYLQVILAGATELRV